MPLVEHDVLGFDVSVHDVVTVGVVQRVGHLHRDLPRLLHRELLGGKKPIPQRFSCDHGHDEIEKAARFPRIEKRKDVWVAQAGCDADLAHETIRADSHRDVRAQDLDGHLSPVPHVVREVNDGHATLTELALDVIAPFERGVQVGDDIGHGLLLDRTWPVGPHTDTRAAGLNRGFASPPTNRPLDCAHARGTAPTRTSATASKSLRIGMLVC